MKLETVISNTVYKHSIPNQMEHSRDSVSISEIARPVSRQKTKKKKDKKKKGKRPLDNISVVQITNDHVIIV